MLLRPRVTPNFKFSPAKKYRNLNHIIKKIKYNFKATFKKDKIYFCNVKPRMVEVLFKTFSPIVGHMTKIKNFLY